MTSIQSHHHPNLTISCDDENNKRSLFDDDDDDNNDYIFQTPPPFKRKCVDAHFYSPPPTPRGKRCRACRFFLNEDALAELSLPDLTSERSSSSNTTNTRHAVLQLKPRLYRSSCLCVSPHNDFVLPPAFQPIFAAAEEEEEKSEDSPTRAASMPPPPPRRPDTAEKRTKASSDGTAPTKKTTTTKWRTTNLAPPSKSTRSGTEYARCA